METLKTDVSKTDASSIIESWYLDLKPSTITFHNLKTGQHIEEPSLVAVRVTGQTEVHGDDPRTGLPFAERSFICDKLLAVGEKALEYKNTQGAIVFSPFRNGQIAHYSTAERLIKILLKQVTPKFSFFKPVLLIHGQRRSTEVEERALVDAGIQSGAKRAYLYQYSFRKELEYAPNIKQTRNAIIIHIEPQEGNE